jgi:hypothetical protein
MITRIAKILSETEVVLGAGENAGVREGMEFVIFEDGEEILDPETKESLGTLEIVKGYVTVVHVQPKVSIARTHSRTVTRTKRTPTGIASWAQEMATGFREEQIEFEQSERLKVDKPDATYQNNLTVHIGDKARTVRE